MNTRSPTLSLVLAVLAAQGCNAARVPLGTEARAWLDPQAATRGELVYVGEVVPRGHDTPAFRYERRVESGPGDQCVSTHATLTLDGTPLVLHRAVHSPDYRLVRFEETNAQRGMTNVVEVRDGGALRFTTRRGGEVETRDEGPGAPVVVGPTLFGHVLAHLHALRGGATLHVRFAVAERGRSYDFRLRARTTAKHETTVDMVASNPCVRLGIAPMRIVIDDRARLPVAYHGRVPPRLHGRPFDADVRYRYATSRYR